MDLHCEELVEESAEDERLEMKEVALVGERPADLAGLLEGAELDLDAPPQGVDVVEALRGNGCRRKVCDEESPAVAQQPFLGRGGAAFPRFAVAHAPVLLGVGMAKAGGDEAARNAPSGVATDVNGDVDAVAAGVPEEVAQLDALAGDERHAGGQTADPEGFTGFDDMKSVKIEEAHVAHDQVSLAAVVEDFPSERLVGIAGVVEIGGEDVSAEEIGEEEAFATGSGGPPVAVVGEMPGVALCHGDDGGVLDEDALEGGVFEPFECTAGLFLEQALVDAEEEGGGGGGEALVHPLAGHRARLEGAELHREMAERGVALGDGAQEGEKETGGAEFEGTPEDES